MLYNDTKAKTIAITDTKFYVPVVTLSTQDNKKLFQKLKLDFKGTINWNKYQSKVTIHAPYPYLEFLTDSRFQGINILFVLSFESKKDRKVHAKYHLPIVEIKDYNFMIDEKYFSINS